MGFIWVERTRLRELVEPSTIRMRVWWTRSGVRRIDGLVVYWCWKLIVTCLYIVSLAEELSLWLYPPCKNNRYNFEVLIKGRIFHGGVLEAIGKLPETLNPIPYMYGDGLAFHIAPLIQHCHNWKCMIFFLIENLVLM